MAIAHAQGDLAGGIQNITPKLLIAAIAARIAFRIKDDLNNITMKLLAIATVIVVAVIFCVIIDGSNQPFIQVVIQESINNTTMVSVAFALRYGMNTLRAKRITHKAELLRKLAEQRAVNARLTPHVLYNMLNAIYAASLKDSHSASHLILSLANMMRHLTDSTDKDFIDAQTELNFMRNYADLTRVQLNDKNAIQLSFPEQVDAQIPNLLCITLFENAVTHSKSVTENPNIVATFEQTEEGFIFSVSNKFEHSQQQNDSEHTGIDSVKQRLAYLYPEHHLFSAGPVSGNTYTAQIEVW